MSGKLGKDGNRFAYDLDMITTLYAKCVLYVNLIYGNDVCTQQFTVSGN